MASPNNFDVPHFPPPPPPTYITPPPPHIHPPPPHILPPPPSPSPDNHTTIIIVVFVSFAGLLFLAFLVFGLCCLIKKKKKNTIEEAELVHVDEHLKVKEAIVEGPHGAQAVVLEIDDDVHADEMIRKGEKLGHVKFVEANKNYNNPSATEAAGTSDHHHP
ncbi:tumor necrosis factor ligand superfamily member 6 [Tripterygium wilfordii]|uniref:Tumor necrosis factor ligand superfamily member 6 n=1 Tax=Tripterygium wilfordii TaxID=458696 RepID=A0A7J7BT47_TRIWF|nr:cysteine-rich receptor-like protein kinase 6 [Tripterygium wilfordii]KAF5725283.1 tumor necrosis factor ligand superfamily member 6 [Tripterygium wilfordii]